ncbi:MAG: hypothetical protein JWP69_1709 [Flaviaesturariibacter sp.]|nr:hypothetical protein [Flaviaesturariibacter sp.]
MRHFRMIATLALLLVGVFFKQSAKAQVAITGPTCVTYATVYDYAIGGTWRDSSTFKVCITGGAIVSSVASCQPSAPVTLVKVMWDSSATAGSLAVESSLGNQTLSATISAPLRGGVIAAAAKHQKVLPTNLPASFSCTQPTGGGCSPAYTFQWEYSYDRLTWASLTGATSQGLVFNTPVTIPTFYRRKTTITNANTIAYSDIAEVFINTDTE